MVSIQSIRLLIAEDHAAVREGLVLLLEQQEDISVVAQAGSGEEAIAMFREHQPDIALMDRHMPGTDGIAAIRAIRAEFPDALILMLSSFYGEEDVYQALQAGAKGYLTKSTSRAELMQAIRMVCAGQSYLPAPIAMQLAERLSHPVLTPRELEILTMVMEGKSNLEIADALFIVEGTVKSHVNSIYQKLGVSSRTEAMTIALKRGLVQLG